MSFNNNFDPSQQGSFDNNGQGPQPPQGMQQQPQQGMQQGQDGGSPAPFAQQGGVEGSGGSVSGDAKTTLWMGELEPWIDENFIRSVWFGMGEQVNVKMIRDKFSGNAGYCFIDFASPAAAAKALTLNGSMIPNTSRPFKLNWASGGGLADRRDERGPEFSIFVGDLGPEVNEYVLVSLFQARFPSCRSAKIMTDPISGMSRGYGFVRFGDESDQQRALTEMQGVYCGNRPMRISTATPKNKSGPAGLAGPAGMPMQPGMPNQMAAPGMYPPMGAPPMAYYGAPQPMNQFTDPNNTTVFVGGLSGYVTEDELRSFFQGFGEITYVKIPPGKGCGFVQFVQRHAAEMAINQMQGYPIGNSRVRLSWGRSQNNSGPAGTPYRPAPPPPHQYQSMGMPPSHPYGNFAPLQYSDHGVFLQLSGLYFYASNDRIAVSPLSVTSQVSDGWDSAFSTMPIAVEAGDEGVDTPPYGYIGGLLVPHATVPYIPPHARLAAQAAAQASAAQHQYDAGFISPTQYQQPASISGFFTRNDGSFQPRSRSLHGSPTPMPRDFISHGMDLASMNTMGGAVLEEGATFSPRYRNAGDPTPRQRVLNDADVTDGFSLDHPSEGGASAKH